MTVYQAIRQYSPLVNDQSETDTDTETPIGEIDKLYIFILILINLFHLQATQAFGSSSTQSTIVQSKTIQAIQAVQVKEAQLHSQRHRRRSTLPVRIAKILWQNCKTDVSPSFGLMVHRRQFCRHFRHSSCQSCPILRQLKMLRSKSCHSCASSMDWIGIGLHFTIRCHKRQSSTKANSFTQR